MIISGGFNVYPQMIEQAIYEHPAVQEAIVIGIPDDYRGDAAKAFVKLRAGAKPFTLEELKAFLAGKLGKHEIPAALEFVDELRAPPSANSRATNCATGSRHRNSRSSPREAVRDRRRPKLHRRPGESRDPYREVSRVARCRTPFANAGGWVPAFRRDDGR